MLFEKETAKLAAVHRTDEHVARFKEILKIEETINIHDTTSVTETDFSFHHLIAMASSNMIYPLLLNSFKQFYMHLASQFFADHALVSIVFEFHNKLFHAIQNKDEEQAANIMEQILTHTL